MPLSSILAAVEKGESNQEFFNARKYPTILKGIIYVYRLSKLEDFSLILTFNYSSCSQKIRTRS